MSRQATERIELLDVVRGLAVLGILLMNIRMFSEPHTAYFNPLVYSDYTGLNKSWWAFQFIFADQKFMAIFSMLFGASTAIICDGLARRGDPVARTYAKRIFGLLIIGLIHAYLLWSGDILVPYAMTSLLPFLFRNVRWKRTLATGIGFLVFGSLWGIAGHYFISSLPADIQANIVAEAWLPSAEAQAAEVAAHQGAWSEHFTYRVATASEFQTSIYLNWGLWRIGGLMLIGLALYRAGFLSGKLSSKTYGRTALIALPIGFILAVTGYNINEAAGWTFPYSMLFANNWNYWGSVIVSVGYVSVFAYLLTATSFRFGFGALTNVGKAALSNYIFQTVACITVFYGFGAGLFGKLERAETALVVIAVWAVQIILSGLWFKKHDKGPLEAIWHKFTYSQWFGSKPKTEAAE